MEKVEVEMFEVVVPVEEEVEAGWQCWYECLQALSHPPNSYSTVPPCRSHTCMLSLSLPLLLSSMFSFLPLSYYTEEEVKATGDLVLPGT